MDYHFLVMEKSWKINVEKEGAPCTKVPTLTTSEVGMPELLDPTGILQPPFGICTASDAGARFQACVGALSCRVDCMKMVATLCNT